MLKLRQTFGLAPSKSVKQTENKRNQKKEEINHTLNPSPITIVPSKQFGQSKEKKESNQSKNKTKTEEIRSLELQKAQNQISEDIEAHVHVEKLENKISKKTNKSKKERMLRQYVECSVCFGEIKKKNMLVFDPACKHQFCNGCIKEHISTQLKQFKVIKCLNERCSIFLDQNSSLLKKVSLEQRQKHQKILLRDKVNKDPHKRFCSIPNCRGYLRTDEDPIICSVCETIFCPKCFNKKHEWLCEDNGIAFLEQVFDFRQCEQCKYMVEKIQGCNHMTCRCGFHFCYLCGDQRNGTHICRPKKVRVVDNELREAIRNAQCYECRLLAYFVFVLPLDLCWIIIFCLFVLGGLILVLVKGLLITPFTKITQICEAEQCSKITQIILAVIVFPYLMICVLSEIEDSFVPKIREHCTRRNLFPLYHCISE